MNSTVLTGKVALVTGAAQGIGEAVARTLAQRGAQVAAVDANEAGLQAVVRDLSGKCGQSLAFPLDIRDSAAVNDTVDRVEASVGPIDILVNVAGILRTGAVVNTSDAEWTMTFDVNTNGVFYLSRAVATLMAPRGSGCIVTVASNAAGVPRMQMGAYAASKAASVQFTKCLALELAQFGIRCNVVSPGSTDTPMLRSMHAPGKHAESTIGGSLEQHRVGIPLGKLAQPGDVAEAVAFLASDASRHITMQDVYVDGGAALQG